MTGCICWESYDVLARTLHIVMSSSIPNIVQRREHSLLLSSAAMLKLEVWSDICLNSAALPLLAPCLS
jgi:hypothetical protein